MLPVQKRIRAKLRRLAPFLVAFGLLTSGIVATQVANGSPAFAGTDTYPSKWSSIPMDTVFDSWGEYNRECTSYVAWMLHSANGFDMPFHDNASGWVKDAEADHYTVNTTPAAGAVAWMSIGHVAWVESVNSDGTVNTEDYNYSYDGTYAEHLNQSAKTYQEYIHFQDLSGSGSGGGGGGGTSTGYEVAFQANNNHLNLYGNAWEGDTNLGMASGTSPAITAVSSGYEAAFQGSDGNLNVYGNALSTDTGLGLMVGTSPSITEVSNGYEVAAQTNNGNLLLYGNEGTAIIGLGMASGTSPSIAGSLVAFQANTGQLWMYNISTGQASNIGLGMASGTSPAVTSCVGCGFLIDFQANNGHLWWYVTGTGQGTDSGLGMMASTSPSEALLSTNANEVAFQANNGHLNLVGAAWSGDTGLGMASGTSPSIAAVSGGYEVAFEANNDDLNVYGNAYSGDLGLGMASGTSPAIE